MGSPSARAKMSTDCERWFSQRRVWAHVFRSSTDHHARNGHAGTAAGCEMYPAGKITKAPHSRQSKGHAEEPLDRRPSRISRDVHRDLPMDHDEKTRHVHVYFLKKKSDAFSCFEAFEAAMEKERSLKMRNLQVDGDGEFISIRCGKSMQCRRECACRSLRGIPHAKTVLQKG